MTDLVEFLLARIAEDEAAVWGRGECEAKRRIVAFLNPSGMPSGEGQYVAERVLELLAQPYREHPDFDPAWYRVEG